MVKEEYYAHSVTPVPSIKKFFKRDETKRTVTFIGDSLQVRIPKRFQSYRMLEITDVIKALGVMDLIINEKYECSLNILGRITIIPSRYEEIVLKDVPYLVAHLEHGDIFINDTNIAQEASVIYAVFCEFVTRGKPLYTFTYEEFALVFDRVKEFVGRGLGVERSVFELIIAHIARDKKDLFKQYRHTDLKSPPVFIDLNNVSLAPTTTSSRLVGAYFEDGLTASLITTSKEKAPFEEIMRGIPSEV